MDILKLNLKDKKGVNHKNKKGKARGESTTTMTVTRINTKKFPASFFEVPANYDYIEGPWEKKKGIF